MENQYNNCPLPAGIATPKKKSKKPVDVSLASMVSEDSACSLASSILNIATAVDKQSQETAVETTGAAAVAAKTGEHAAGGEPSQKKKSAKSKREIPEGPTTVTVTVTPAKSKPKKPKKEKSATAAAAATKPVKEVEKTDNDEKMEFEDDTVKSPLSSSPETDSAEQTTEIGEPAADSELQRKQQEETVQLATAKKRKLANAANGEGAGKKSRKNGNESAANSTNGGSGKNGGAGNANQITVLVRHHGKIEFAKPIVMEWSPIAAPGVKSVEKYQYLRLPASENVEIKPLMCKIIDLNYGLQFGDKTSHQTNIWTLHNWEPLMCEGVTISSAEPNLQNIRLLLHNCSDNTVLVKQGDPLAIVRFYPMPKKINMKFSSLNE